MVAELKEQIALEAQQVSLDGTSSSSLRKLAGVLVQPGAAFREIATQPAWFLALLGATLVRVAETFLYFNPNKSALGLALNFIFAAIPSVFVVLACSSAFFLALFLWGAETSFGRVFAVLAHTFFVYTLVMGVMRCAMLAISGDPARVDFQNPVASNPGFLVDSRAHPALQYLASSIDLLVLYHLFLIGLGLSVIVEGIRRRSVVTVVAVLWVIYLAVITFIKSMVF